MTEAPALTDQHRRRIDYVRLSLTDRCDMRCRYCMAEDMIFMPHTKLLRAEEIVTLSRHLVGRGVRRIRLTGGEPLVRRDAVAIAREIGTLLGCGLDELTMTTNGARLASHAAALRDAGIARINISLDTLDPELFRKVTRVGELAAVLDGIAAAAHAGMAVKINTVVMRGLNDETIVDMLRWCGDRGHDLTLIETMPLGRVDDDRVVRFWPLDKARAAIEAEYNLLPGMKRTGGPARYWQVPALGITLGLISPLTNNFCSTCNRIRVSADGALFMCLGHEDKVDLRAALRGGDLHALDDALDRALLTKPARHEFDLTIPATTRHMSVTGG